MFIWTLSKRQKDQKNLKSQKLKKLKNNIKFTKQAIVKIEEKIKNGIFKNFQRSKMTPTTSKSQNNE